MCIRDRYFSLLCYLVSHESAPAVHVPVCVRGSLFLRGNLSGAGGSHMKGTWNIASGSRLTGVSGTVTVGGENGLDSLSIALGTEVGV